MPEGSTFTFCDSDGYVAAFGDVRFNLTIAGAGDFKARLTRLKLHHLEFYQCYEHLPRIGSIALPPGKIFLSFSIDNRTSIFNGTALRNDDMVLHGCGERMHQRSGGKYGWGLISLSPEQLAIGNEALTGHPFTPPQTNRIFRPARAEIGRLRRLFRQACRLSETRRETIDRPEVARALEQEMIHAIISCLSADERNDTSKTRHQRAAVMARFEEALSERIDQKLTMPGLSAELGVPERTLRMCCAEFLGVSPTRYILLKRLNQARLALRRADPSTASVAEVARNHQFLELGRFAVTYRTTFGESPSVTLQRRLYPSS